MTNPKPPTDPRKPCEICDSTDHTTGYHESGVSPQGYHESGVAPEKSAVKEGER